VITVAIDELDGSPECACIRVTGEIDMWTVEPLNDTLGQLDTTRRQVVIDLSAVTFIDSTGIGALVGHARDLETNGVALATVSQHPAVDRVLSITGVSDLLNVKPTLDDAVAHVRAGH
jgi:anti-sigma B factor antagonist